MTEELLQILAEKGEMDAKDFLAKVSRNTGTYIDFFPVAALLHADYIFTDSPETERGGKKIVGKLGFNTQETAIFLCQLMLPPGESFKINNCDRNSAHNFPLKIFITAEGYLRLDELEQRKTERKQKRIDYIVTFFVAVSVALLSSYLTHYFATKRLQLEPIKQSSTPISGSNLNK